MPTVEPPSDPKHLPGIPTTVPEGQGTKGDGEQAETYTIRVAYYYAEEEEAASADSRTVPEGEKYYIVAPVIPGFRASMPIVEGIMPGCDVYITVLYTPDREDDEPDQTIEQFTVPLGFQDVFSCMGECYE